MQCSKPIAVGKVGIGTGGEALVDEVQVRVQGGSVEQSCGVGGQGGGVELSRPQRVGVGGVGVQVGWG